jgi:methionyl-tRNA formyltransferase
MRVVFFGSPAFAVPTLRAVAARHEVVLAVSQPDRPSGRGQSVTPPAVKQAALELGVRTLQPIKMKDPALTEQLAALAADVFVVVAYGRILPRALLELPRLGPYNVHGSLLPRYRGAAPIQWSIMRGESVTGISIMQMDEGLDTGPVLIMREEPIGDDDTTATLAQRLSTMGADLMVETLPLIEAGSITPVPQEHAEATLAPLLKKEDGLLDFSRTARLVSAQARGVDPWPGASAVLEGETVKLFRPTVVEGRGQPGEVLGLSNEGLRIACAEDALAFAELQLPGRKRMPAAALLAGRPISPGTRMSGGIFGA